ncbi:MAG: enoyl-ACP reductase [Planctomycetes bacterium]|nr:enoyl-ACP reductase [Planctomycetota bacterium]MCC7397496.1 enoyl-ACP reductase [Planctomycetota bacterium]
MGLMSGKNVVIFGVANKRSIAWGIAQALHREGARLALNFQNERMEEPVRKLAAELPEDTFVAPCDVTVPGDIERYFERLGKEFGPLDGLVHSIAFAKREELGGNFVDTSWEGYQIAQQVSSWSLIGLVKGALPLMAGREAGVVCLSYYGAEKVVQNYNVMGVAKAALEASTRYLANDVGQHGVRVNAVSAGPIKTVSAMGVSDFGSLLDNMAKKAPLRRNIDQADVGNTAVFLLSHLARGITGQTIYVDAGYSILGA